MVAAGFGVAALAAQERYEPARLVAAAVPSLPALPTMAVGGGEVYLQVEVDEAGQVHEVTPLRSTPSFTDPFVAAVSGWRFEPARVHAPDPATGADTEQPVSSMVFVGEVVLAPSLLVPTLGEVPADVNSPDPQVPYPTAGPAPPMPPTKFTSGTVIVEIDIAASGRTSAPRIVQAAAGLDDAALSAARGWRFRPARVGGRAAASRAYLVFGFPVIAGAAPGGPAR